MQQALELLNYWLKLLAPFGVAGGLLWKFWLKEKIAKLSDLYTKIQIIAEEFRPNGGSTLRDAINRIESKVSLQQQTTTAIIKSFPIGTWISDEKGKCIDVNKNMCKITGRTETELKGDNWANWVVEKDDVLDEWVRCINNDSNFDYEYHYHLPDRRKQLVHSVAQRLKNDKGELVGFLGTMEPIGAPV